MPDVIRLHQGVLKGKATGRWHPLVRDIALVRQITQEAGLPFGGSSAIAESDFDQFLMAASDLGFWVETLPAMGQSEILEYEPKGKVE